MRQKIREYIVSYTIISNKLNRKGIGNTVTKETGKIFDFSDWQTSAVDFWNKEWKTDDVSIILTNIFENK